MRGKIWLNLVLLLLVSLLALVAYLEPGSQQPDHAQSLMSLPVSQVERIQLQQGDAQAITVERQVNGWMIVDPIRVAASDYRIDSLLQLLSATSYSSFAASVRPLSAFGLEQPLARVLFNDRAVLFGDIEPLNNRRYVLIDDQVHLIDDRYFYQSQLLLSALVDTALLPAGSRLVQISLPGLSLGQHQGDWQLQSPDDGVEVAAMDDVNELVNEWQNARALQVSRYQADVAEADIELVDADGGSMMLELLAREPELILGRKELGLRYHFTADQADRLLSLPRRHTVSEADISINNNDN